MREERRGRRGKSVNFDGPETSYIARSTADAFYTPILLIMTRYILANFFTVNFFFPYSIKNFFNQLCGQDGEKR